MKTVSILGCGRTGTAIGRTLVRAGYAVKGSTTTPARFESLKAAGIEPAELKVDADFPQGSEHFFNADVLVVTLSPARSNDKDAISYTEQLARISKAAAAAGIGQLIFTGATFIYPSRNCEVREGDVEQGNSTFMGLDWLAVEQAVGSAMPEKTTILRLAGLMGEGHNAAHYFSGRPMAGADDPVNMVHQDDVAGVVLKLVEQDVKGEVFNLAAPLHPTRREYYTRASKLAGVAPPLFSSEPGSYRLINCDHLQERIGYTFLYPDPLEQ